MFFRNLRYLLFPVLNVIGPILIVFSAIMLIPLFLSLKEPEMVSRGFEYGALSCFSFGVFLLVLTRHDKRELLPRDGFLMASLIWVLIPLFASIPLYFGIENTNFAHAFFEAMSGTTTTCATAYSGLDAFPASLNLWRCLLSWLGGMGILVLAVAILPLLGVGGAQIFRAETSGPMKENKLTPRIADTAKALWWIYFVFTVFCVTAYFLAGMTPFDAVCHAFTTVSLGGFSTHDSSFAFWNSPLIETVAVVFMLICGLNFSMHFLVWKNKSFLLYFRNAESRAWLLTALAVIATTFALLFVNGYADKPLDTIRYVVFNSVSVISTTGYSNYDYAQWPIPVSVLMLFCATFATCGGSTGGGIKMMRAIILLKQLGRGFIQTMHPTAIVPLRVQNHTISDNLIFTVLNYVLLWIGTLLVTMIFLLVTGLDPLTSISTALACITNTGPGLGSVGPMSNYALLSNTQLWLCAFCMLVGRLELVTVFVLFTRRFWQI